MHALGGPNRYNIRRGGGEFWRVLGSAAALRTQLRILNVAAVAESSIVTFLSIITQKVFKRMQRQREHAPTRSGNKGFVGGGEHHPGKEHFRIMRQTVARRCTAHCTHIFRFACAMPTWFSFAPYDIDRTVGVPPRSASMAGAA